MEQHEQSKAGQLVCASVFDAKVGVYFQPFFARSTAEALRSFGDTINQDGHIFNKHPADFTLFMLAKWNEENGHFDPTPTPIALAVGIELLEVKEDKAQLDLVQSAGSA